MNSQIARLTEKDRWLLRAFIKAYKKAGHKPVAIDTVAQHYPTKLQLVTIKHRMKFLTWKLHPKNIHATRTTKLGRSNKAEYAFESLASMHRAEELLNDE